VWDNNSQMRESNLLGADVNLEELAARTKNYSGSELAGLIRSATSYALYGNIDVTKVQPTEKPEVKDIKNIKIVMEHFLAALDETVPAFGVAEEDLKTCLRGEMLDWGAEYRRVLHTGKMLVKQVAQSNSTPLLSAIIEGPSGSGKTALAAKIALESGFPYIKLISPENFVDSSERGKVLDINKIFEDAYKSPLSLIIIDNIERLLEYVPIGPRFSNTVLQCLLVLLKKIPPADGRRLIVFATTSNMRILEDMDMRGAFNVVMHMPQLRTPADVSRAISLMNLGVEEKELDVIAKESPLPIGIKELLMVIEMARQDVTTITAARFSVCYPLLLSHTLCLLPLSLYSFARLLLRIIAMYGRMWLQTSRST
jgi:vesicle-fusing ATPase